AVRRRAIRAGPQSLAGQVGLVRSWSEPSGYVLVEGTLWRACRSALDDDERREPMHPGDKVVVDHLDGMMVAVRRAEEWELIR
ncbi:MAG: hypothetical protein JO206_06020, partial [Solirubrobacterales bacterium]|nr:hypothetical protein [Solirubrobacterales bacterium]